MADVRQIECRGWRNFLHVSVPTTTFSSKRSLRPPSANKVPGDDRFKVSLGAVAVVFSNHEANRGESRRNEAERCGTVQKTATSLLTASYSRHTRVILTRAHVLLVSQRSRGRSRTPWKVDEIDEPEEPKGSDDGNEDDEAVVAARAARAAAQAKAEADAAAHAFAGWVEMESGFGGRQDEALVQLLKIVRDRSYDTVNWSASSQETSPPMFPW